jgi:hypothetical protein
MSDSVQENTPVVDEIPQEVKDLHKAMTDMAAYRNAVTQGMFPGVHAESVAKLREYLKSAYEQVFKQFNEHPHVVKAHKDLEDKKKAKASE